MPALPLDVRFCIDRLATEAPGVPAAWSEGWLAGAEPLSAAWLRRPGWVACAQRRWAAWRSRPTAQFRLRFGFPRPDVAEALPQLPQAGHSGWHAMLPRNFIQPGRGVELVVQRPDQSLAAGVLRWIPRDVQHARLRPLAYSPPDDSVGLEAESALLESRLRTVLERQPGLVVRLDIINKCNLRCVMCHFADERIFKRPARHITPEQFAEFFASLAPAVHQVVLSCGDEPLVSPHFEAVLRFLAEQYPHVDIVFNTNGMLLSERYARAVVECKVATVMISIDGVTAQTFESIRRGARFEQVLGNLVRLRRLRDAAGSARPWLVVNCVLMRRNLHEAPLLVTAAQELGLEYIDFRHVVTGSGYDASRDTLSNEPARFNHYRELILATAQEQGVSVCIPPAYPGAGTYCAASEPAATLEELQGALARAPAVADPVAQAPCAQPHQGIEGTPEEEFRTLFCTRPFSEVMIRDQEEILPCPFYARVLGRLSDGSSLREVFEAEAFQRLRHRMLWPEGDPGCASCPVKRQQLSRQLLTY